jgi:O-glycosyl hydrolase
MAAKFWAAILSTVKLFGLTALVYGQATVTIGGNTTYQTIRGWGGNTYSWILNNWNGWTNDQVYEIAFNEQGMTHVRMVTEFECWEPDNDDNDPNHFNWAYFQSRFQRDDDKSRLVQSDFKMMEKIVTTFKKQLLIGIWNVPNWMVTDPMKKDHRDLPYSKHAEFAESVAAYLLWARDHRGIHIPQIVLANEPDGYQVEYSPEELRDLIKTVGAKFKREGLATKIVAPDLASPYYDPDIWVTTLLNDPVAASYLGAVSYHTYYVDGGPEVWNAKFARIAALAAAKGLEVYYTEVGTTPWHIANISWPWAFDCMQMWHNILTHGNANLGFQWALLGRDAAVNADATRNPIFYALEQFFHHIHIGSVRLGAQSDQRALLVSAFKHAGKNSAQIVCINRSAANLNVTVNLQNLNLPMWEGYCTSENENHVHVSSYRAANHSFRLTIPARAVMTLDGTNVPATGVQGRVEPIRQFRLWQNYPNPFSAKGRGTPAGVAFGNPETTIDYELGASGHINLSVFNIKGEKVKTLIAAKQQAGKHTVRWCGNDEAGEALVSGIYWYRLEAEGMMAAKKMILVR